jgi:class 3 adenylate cyclase
VALPPETRFARNGEDKVAYQVIGDGPIDLVYFSGAVSNVDVRWEHPNLARLLERLASFSRLILFDRRGTGCSDPVDVNRLPSWEEWTDDLKTVLDAVGSERAAIFAILDAGPMAMMFAGTYPERTSALVLANTAARYSWAEDNPSGFPADQLATIVDAFTSTWGTPAAADIMYPSRTGDEAFRQWYAKFLRSASSPREVKVFLQALVEMDVRHVLPLIQAPTLVLVSNQFAAAPVGLVRDLAARISNSKFVELPTAEGSFLSGGPVADEAIALVEEFLTGASLIEPDNRTLATVMFTDIVGSTQHAAELGDSAWRSLLEEHRWLVRSEVQRHRGREVKTTGDGFLLLFDGPGRAARCACAITRQARSSGLELRMGLHTGECRITDGDVDGIAVHVASRVMERAQPTEVLATGTVRDLVVGSSLQFQSRGRHSLKGVPGQWSLYAVAE